MQKRQGETRQGGQDESPSLWSSDLGESHLNFHQRETHARGRQSPRPIAHEGQNGCNYRRVMWGWGPTPLPMFPRKRDDSVVDPLH